MTMIPPGMAQKKPVRASVPASRVSYYNFDEDRTQIFDGIFGGDPFPVRQDMDGNEINLFDKIGIFHVHRPNIGIRHRLLNFLFNRTDVFN